MASKQTMKDKVEIQTIKETLGEIFEKLQIDGDFSLEQEEDVINIVLNTEDVGIVVGYHGEVLESLQFVASLAVSKKIGRFIRVSIDAGEYKKQRTDYLTHLAQQTKDRVLSEQREVSLSNLKSWERRIIHVMLQDDKEVMSESAGVGRDRTLVIKPRE